MLTQPFLRQLINSAVRTWRIAPAAIYRSASRDAVRARIAVFHAAYEHGCQQSDLAVAFGWSGTGRRNLSPHEVCRAHAGYTLEGEYHSRFTELVTHAAAFSNAQIAGRRYYTHAA